MRFRFDTVVQATPSLHLELDLREAWALGTVLRQAAGDRNDIAARRMRARSDEVMAVRISCGLPEAAAIASAITGAYTGRTPATETGQRALSIAEAIDQARACDLRNPTARQWTAVPTDPREQS